MMPSVLMVTHNPFWKRDRGSRQRIAGLVRALEGSGVAVHACFVGALGDQDHAEALASGLASIRASGPEPAFPGCRLDDFKTDVARDCFAACLRDVRPGTVLVQQIRHAYLVAEMPDELRRRVTLAIDTHDVMHERARRFADAGHRHWLDISREEEARALAPFDLVLAIQSREARLLEAMASHARTLCVPHAMEIPDSPTADPASGRCVVGFVGIGNDPNTDAAKRLLGDVWPSVRRAHADACELRIAGTVGDRLGRDLPAGVTTLGFVDDLDAFYKCIDVIATPIAFGGGLNIKNVEALVHGRALVTSPIGAEGLESGIGSAFLVGSNRRAWADAMTRLAADHDRIRELGERARAFARRVFSPERAYAPLIDAIRTSARRAAS